jgi:hypothetical protein
MNRESIPLEQLKSVVSNQTTPESRKSKPTSSAAANPRSDLRGIARLLLDDYLTDYGVGFRKKDEPTADGREVYQLQECPFDPEHGKRGESCVMQDSSGKLSFKCQHDSCSSYGWQDVKKVFGAPRKHHFDGEMSGSRVIVEVSNDEHTVNQKVIDVLKDDSELYQRGSDFVRVVTDARPSDGIRRAMCVTRIVIVTLPYLRDRICRLIDFRKLTAAKDGPELKPVNVPNWCVQGVGAARYWPEIRPISGVITTPVVREDGSLINKPGYDEQTGLFFEPIDEVLQLPDNPSKDDAKEAANRLLDVFSDFPFARSEHRAALLAYILTLLSRQTFDGPSPLFLLDANVRGSGKSLIVDLVSIITSGHDISRMSNPKDDDECRKRITALALAGDRAALIDNVAGNLGCPSLDAALTSTQWKDRILGRSEIVELPLTVTWAATGNNVMLAADTSRRVVHIRLESPEERPEERDGFRHPNIRCHVRENRRALLTDALTIVSAFIKAGKPNQDLPPWGSFEGWSDVVRQAVVWCGLPDPGLTRQELVESSDREANALRQLLLSWAEIDPQGHGLSVGELLTKLAKSSQGFPVFRDALLEFAPPSKGDLPASRQLGKRLARFRKRVVTGRYLDYREGRARARFWFVGSVNKSSRQPPEFLNGDSDDSSDSVSARR